MLRAADRRQCGLPPPPIAGGAGWLLHGRRGDHEDLQLRSSWMVSLWKEDE